VGLLFKDNKITITKRKVKIMTENLTEEEKERLAEIILTVWEEADHLSGMYNGDFRWAISRLVGNKKIKFDIP